MDILKKRKTPLQSKVKVVTCIELYEKYVDEPIEDIKIYSSTSYLINNKWSVDIKNNKVDKSYSDPSWDD